MDRSIRVLVAEPDADIRRSFIETLRTTMVCDAIEASDGREALVAALVRRPTAVVLDSLLPVVTAPALCEILRYDPMTRSVPIIALSGSAAQSEVDRIRSAGADTILIKPVPPSMLVEELRRITSEGRPRIPRVELTAQPTPKPSGTKRLAKSKAHVRCSTTTPPMAPPALRCPSCDSALQYERSYVGGVSQRHAEQWDHFSCAACGTFEYRHRTRRLRRVDF